MTVQEASALLVIDLQMGFLYGESSSAYRADRLLKTVSALQHEARRHHTPVIHLQFDGPTGHPTEVGTDGWAIHPQVAPLADELVIRKRSCDSFHRTDLDQQLRERDVTRLHVTGFATELCVDTTCRRGLTMGYDVTLVADGHSTADGGPPLHPEPIARIRWWNHCLSRLINEDHRILVQPSTAITF